MMSAQIEESIQCPVCCPHGLRVTKAKQCLAAVTGADRRLVTQSSHRTSQFVTEKYLISTEKYLCGYIRAWFASSLVSSEHGSDRRVRHLRPAGAA